MKKLVLILFVVSFPILCSAQQSRIDSLNASQPDTTNWKKVVYKSEDCECFTEEEIDGLYKGIRELELNDSLKTQKINLLEQQIDQLNVQINNYKDLSNLKDQHINLLEKRLDLKDDQIELLEKKVRRTRFKSIFRGLAAGVVLGLVINI